MSASKNQQPDLTPPEGDPYVPGDIIPGVGKVDTNHMGLPWPATDTGLAFGCVSLINKPGLYDALDGRELSEGEIEGRTGTKRFDYGNRTTLTERPQREMDAIHLSITDRQAFERENINARPG